MELFNEINQIFHNKGINQDKRFNILLEIIEDKNKNFKEIFLKFDKASRNLETIQECFMTLCSKYTKQKLDQYYTPINIASFINSLLVQDISYNLLEPVFISQKIVILLFKIH